MRQTSDWTEDVGDGVRSDVVGEVLDAACSQPCPVLPTISNVLPGPSSASSEYGQTSTS